MRYTWRLTLAALAVPSLLAAQAADSASAERAPAARRLTTVGSAVEEQLRDAQLRGDAPSAGFLVRSPSSMTPRGAGAGATLILPQADLAWNSRIPTTANDGAMWAGRGASAVVMAGGELRAGIVRLVVAPELVWAENREFDDLLPRQWTAEQRAAFLPPWQTAQHSADIPYRFGDGGWTKLRPGQSSLTLRAGGFAAGAATENQWWGPGVRNAIIMTNNGPGIPHLFARTGQPVRTRLGHVDAKWMVGTLAGSGYAGGEDSGRRSLNAAAVVLHPAGAPNLGVGIARAVYAPEEGFAGALSHSADVLTRWGGAGDTLRSEPFEQITSLLARWVFPRDGAEVYAEWARYRLPGSLGDLLEAPEHTQGYIVGAQWLRPVRAGELRLQAEAAGLEKSSTYRSRPIGSYYASAAVPGGYTQEGQVIGAGIGPGASGQWLAADWLRRGGLVGAFLGRVRSANDAYYDNPATTRISYQGGTAPQSTVHGHDVTVFGGLRGRLPLRGVQLDAEWTAGQRYNYMFQSYAIGWSNRDDAVDVMNHTLRLGISARLRR
ncbi:MAG TPA: capsule assembly Wzi family protein [Longimicrobium sp.]|jgi:hypothetical protein